MTDNKEKKEETATTVDPTDGMLKVKSSNIDAVGFYDDKGKDARAMEHCLVGNLLVRFNNGTTWRYKNVPRGTVETILQAKSVGKAFNQEIKLKANEFPGQKVIDNGKEKEKDAE